MASGPSLDQSPGNAPEAEQEQHQHEHSLTEGIELLGSFAKGIANDFVEHATDTISSVSDILLESDKELPPKASAEQEASLLDLDQAKSLLGFAATMVNPFSTLTSVTQSLIASFAHSLETHGEQGHESEVRKGLGEFEERFGSDVAKALKDVLDEAEKLHTSGEAKEDIKALEAAKEKLQEAIKKLPPDKQRELRKFLCECRDAEKDDGNKGLYDGLIDYVDYVLAQSGIYFSDGSVELFENYDDDPDGDYPDRYDKQLNYQALRRDSDYGEAFGPWIARRPSNVQVLWRDLTEQMLEAAAAAEREKDEKKNWLTNDSEDERQQMQIDQVVRHLEFAIPDAHTTIALEQFKSLDPGSEVIQTPFDGASKPMEQVAENVRDELEAREQESQIKEEEESL